MTYWKGAGSSIGEGLGLMVNSFISRQDQLKQQQQQEEQLRGQAEQQTLQNQRAAEQLEMQRQDAARAAANDEYTRTRNEALDARQTRVDGAQEREGEYRNGLREPVNAFLTGLDADLERYAPTTKDGRSNPGYDRAMYEATKARRTKALKLWLDVGNSVGSGEGWGERKGALMTYLGMSPDDAPTPVQGPPPLPATPAAAPPAPAAMQGPPAPAAAPQAAPPPAPGVQGPQQPQALPATINEIPPSQLASLDDAVVLQKYGQEGLNYARAGRAEYAAQLAAREKAVGEARMAGWAEQQKELAKRDDLTPAQRTAMLLINDYMSRPSLDAGQQQGLAAAFQTLAPAAYTAASWQKVVDTKDPAVILAQLPVYQKLAPEVVAGFDAEPLRLMYNAGIDKATADALQARASAGASTATALRTTSLLPGEVAQQGADLLDTQAGIRKTDAEVQRVTELLPLEKEDLIATTDGREATTAGTRQDTANDQLTARKTAFDLGVQRLVQLAGTNATIYQLKTADPQAWYALKRDLGLTDAALAAVVQQARAKENQTFNAAELENRLKGSQILTDSARRAGIFADTAATVQGTANDAALAPLTRANLAAETANIHSQMVARDTELQPRLNLLNAQIRTELAQGRNVSSLIRERDALLPLRAAETTARTANLWVRTADARSATVARDRKLQPELDRLNAQIVTERARGQDVTSLTRRRDALLPYETSSAAQALKIERQKADAYLQNQAGNYAVDMARVKQITASTALTRAKDPNDPLYNPVIANSKSGDPVDALKKKAGIFYAQGDQALKQAQTAQGQINSLTALGKNFAGTFSLSSLSPADQKKLTTLTNQRDALFRQAQAARQKGDDVVTQGMETLPTSVTSTAADLYGVKDMGGVKMVTTFTGRTPVPPSFNQAARFAVSRTAGRLGIDANALAAVISFETGGTFSPSARNPGSTASGLIQFIETTAKGLGTTTAALRAMPFGKQMEYVERYLRERGIGPGADIADIYAAVTGSGYRRGTLDYEKNAVWDANGNGVIEKGEQVRSPAFQSHVRDYFGGGGAPAGPVAPTATPPGAATRPAPGPAKPAASPTSTGQLEAGLRAAIINKDGNALNTYADQLVKAGYSPDRVTALIKKYQGGS